MNISYHMDIIHQINIDEINKIMYPIILNSSYVILWSTSNN